MGEPRDVPPRERRDQEAARVDGVSDERLINLFSKPQSPQRLIAGMRVLGFTADAVQSMTDAKSRDVVYAWAAGRSRPSADQAKRLDEIRRALFLICANAELGPDSAWMLFNARFGRMDEEGPTAMEMISNGRSAAVMEELRQLIDDEGDGGEPPPEGDPSPEPSPEAVGNR